MGENIIHQRSENEKKQVTYFWFLSHLGHTQYYHYSYETMETYEIVCLFWFFSVSLVILKCLLVIEFEKESPCMQEAAILVTEKSLCSSVVSSENDAVFKWVLFFFTKINIGW